MAETKTFQIRAHRGAHAKRFPEIARVIPTVFVGASASFDDRHLSLAVRAPAELETQIRVWLEVMLHV